jgi:hypothetical protein
MSNDRLPEDTWFRDTGCDLFASCLSCELPACRYDMPPKRARSLKRQAQVTELLQQGRTAEECAAALGVSRRSFYRLKKMLPVALVDTLTLTTRPT